MKTSHIQLKGREKLSLFSDMSTMLTAGIPISETIESLESDAKGNMRKVLTTLSASITNGEPLSQGLEHFPKTFDPVTLNTIQAAETGGTLEETLQDVVRTLKKELAFSSTIRTAMIYPAFIGVIFTGIVLLMLTFVIPRISQVFNGMHVDIPPLTQFMFNLSDTFLAHWIPISAAAIILVALAAMFTRANSRAIIRIMLAIPGLRQLGLNIDLARLTRSFALLLRSGLPLDDALILAKRVVRKPQIIRVIDHMQHNLETGKSLGEGLHEAGFAIPPIMSRSIETAETSGTLEPTMQNLAEYFDEQVTESLKAATSLLEPVMIVVIGLMVGGLMITIIAPIYNLISQVSPTQ